MSIGGMAHTAARWHSSCVTEQPSKDATEPAKDTFVERTKKVHEAWGRMFLIFGILVVGVGGFIQEKVQEVLTFWQVIWLTLPLTAAVAILAYRVFAKQAITLSVFIGTVIGTLVASIVTGLSSGNQVAAALFHADYNLDCLSTDSCTTSDPASGGPIGLVFRIFGAYLHVYGGIGVIKALVAGVFIAYGIHEMTRDRLPAKAPSKA